MEVKEIMKLKSHVSGIQLVISMRVWECSFLWNSLTGDFADLLRHKPLLGSFSPVDSPR